MSALTAGYWGTGLKEKWVTLIFAAFCILGSPRRLDVGATVVLTDLGGLPPWKRLKQTSEKGRVVLKVMFVVKASQS